MFEVAWQEILRSGKIVTKRKTFKTRVALDSFVKRLFDKDGFWQIYGIREG